MPELKADHLPFPLPAKLAFLQPLLSRLFRWRYIRFATVGASGTVVNIGVLFVLQEWTLPLVVTDASLRLSMSLLLAIAVATVNNFAWNSLWTWADRLADSPTARLGWDRHTIKLFFKYTVSCWLGIVIQYGLTWLFPQRLFEASRSVLVSC